MFYLNTIEQSFLLVEQLDQLENCLPYSRLLIGISMLSVFQNHSTILVRYIIEMFYLNTIEQLFLFVEQLDHLEVCLPYSRLLTGIPILAVFQNLRWNSNKTSLHKIEILQIETILSQGKI